uniref:Uncharacterized protein n=1 Tax=Moniliophthora roreri TaxID=221103 RepID=A0A0W0G0T4_MONRR
MAVKGSTHGDCNK